jgi:tetratricopeptide (TPR) repeat protein
VAALTERDLKDKAHLYMARGALADALEVYRQLITMNGKDPSYRLRHAEVCVRLGRTQAAVGSYRIAAHLLSEAGRVAQAKAALHSAVRLAPKDMALRRAVRDLIHADVVPTHHVPVLLATGDDAITEPCLLPLLE